MCKTDSICQPVRFLDISNTDNWKNEILILPPSFLRTVHYLDVSHNLVKFLSFHLLRPFGGITALYMHHCSLTEIHTAAFAGVKRHTLDLSHNLLQSLDQTWLSLAFHLRHIFLQHNAIVFVDLFAFDKSSHLISLNLSNNKILFSMMEPKHHLSIHLSYVAGDDQFLCCMIQNAKQCFVRGHTLHSCSSLLASGEERWGFGVISITVLILNLTTAVYIILWKSHHRHAKKRTIAMFSLVSLTDACYGAYLFGLIISNYSYGSEFSIYSEKWKVSLSCSCLDVIMSYYNSVSSLLIIHMNFSLLYSTIRLRPLGSWKFSLSLSSIVICGLIISVLRKALLTYLALNHPNRICFPFPISKLREISNNQFLIEAVFMVVKFAILCLVFVSFSSILKVVMDRKQKKLGKSASKTSRRTLMKMALNIVLLGVSKLPLFFVEFLSLTGLEFSFAWYRWMLIVSISIWPICNPFLHTLKELIQQKIRKV